MKVGRQRKELVIRFGRRRGRPSKDVKVRKWKRLVVVGTIDEIDYLKEQAKLSGKSISRYIIESII